MNRVKKTAFILLLVTTPMLATAAQNPPVKKSSTEQTASEKAQPGNPLQRKITSVLDQVLEAQKSFTDETLRIMIQAQVADMLWSYDEPPLGDSLKTSFKSRRDWPIKAHLRLRWGAFRLTRRALRSFG